MVSTFEKKNSLSVKLLFGNPEITRPVEHVEHQWANAYEHFFLPRQIFGIELESKGADYQKFHYALVLQACDEGKEGVVVPGITPGAKVLVKTTKNTATKRFIKILNKILIKNLDLTKIEPENFHKLNDLLLLNMAPNFFIGELLG